MGIETRQSTLAERLESLEALTVQLNNRVRELEQRTFGLQRFGM